MKKLVVISFASAFVLALALPASAQSVCGTSGTEGMPSCSSVKAGTGCCIPPAPKVSSKTVKKGGKVKAEMAHANQVQVTVHVNSNQPAEMGTGNGGNGGSVPSVSHTVVAQKPTAPAAMATGPTSGASVVSASASATPAAPAAAAGAVSHGAGAGGSAPAGAAASGGAAGGSRGGSAKK